MHVFNIPRVYGIILYKSREPRSNRTFLPKHNAKQEASVTVIVIDSAIKIMY